MVIPVYLTLADCLPKREAINLSQVAVERRNTLLLREQLNFMGEPHKRRSALSEGSENKTKSVQHPRGKTVMGNIPACDFSHVRKHIN